ncbi:MAG: hypothetical protein N0C86_11415, partial [Candidatus Thiodiazotropha taylori]|nr:hypothetical protein [Candidatus Thiodiazotropha taylori]MCW4326595.1 hypothetical protein [Candidatus Thiodiazotropha taylori]
PNPVAIIEPPTIPADNLANFSSIFYSHNAKVSGIQHGALARAKMAKPCPSKCGVLNVRVSRRRTA